MESQCDMFSHLPVALVLKISSFLSLADAFKLSSTRREWFSFELGRYCGSMELHEDKFFDVSGVTLYLNLGQRSRAQELKLSGKLDFIRFLNETIYANKSSSLYKLSLQIGFTSNIYDQVVEVIRFALGQSVVDLTLDFLDRDLTMPLRTEIFSLPKHFYQNGRSVRLLNLTSCILDDEFNLSNFVNLTSLALTRVRFEVRKVSNDILDCPLLENLALVDCFNVKKIELGEGMGRLRSLVIKNCEIFKDGFELAGLPSLTSFEYTGDQTKFRIETLEVLEELVLDFKINTPNPYSFWEMNQLLSGFLHQRRVSIATTAFMVLPREFNFNGPRVQWPNVDSLKMKTSFQKYELPGMLCLLQNAPYVRELTVVIVSMSDVVASMHNEECPDDLPRNFWTSKELNLEHLESVLMENYSGEGFEFAFLEFILKVSKSLKKVLIRSKTSKGVFLSSKEFEDLSRLKENVNGAATEWELL